MASSKVNQAVALMHGKKDDHKDFLKGLGILRFLILNKLNSKENRLYALEVLHNYDKDEAHDILARFRDMLVFIDDGTEEVFIITKMSLNSKLDSHERIVCAVSLFNNGFITECMEIFLFLAKDEKLSPSYRVEACMYLIYSNREDLREETINILNSIILNRNLTCEF
jgi:hypothetical protein